MSEFDSNIGGGGDVWDGEAGEGWAGGVVQGVEWLFLWQRGPEAFAVIADDSNFLHAD